MLINFLLLTLIVLAAFFALSQILTRKRQRKCAQCSLAHECQGQNLGSQKTHLPKDSTLYCKVFKN